MFLFCFLCYLWIKYLIGGGCCCCCSSCCISLARLKVFLCFYFKFNFNLYFFVPSLSRYGFKRDGIRRDKYIIFLNTLFILLLFGLRARFSKKNKKKLWLVFLIFEKWVTSKKTNMNWPRSFFFRKKKHRHPAFVITTQKSNEKSTHDSRHTALCKINKRARKMCWGYGKWVITARCSFLFGLGGRQCLLLPSTATN